jgi:hypothetical protein
VRIFNVSSSKGIVNIFILINFRKVKSKKKGINNFLKVLLEEVGIDSPKQYSSIIVNDIKMDFSVKLYQKKMTFIRQRSSIQISSKNNTIKEIEKEEDKEKDRKKTKSYNKEIKESKKKRLSVFRRAIISVISLNKKRSDSEILDDIDKIKKKDSSIQRRLSAGSPPRILSEGMKKVKSPLLTSNETDEKKAIKETKEEEEEKEKEKFKKIEITKNKQEKGKEDEEKEKEKEENIINEDEQVRLRGKPVENRKSITLMNISIKTKNNSSQHNIFIDNVSDPSFGHNSNSSELNDDKDSDNDNTNNNNSNKNNSNKNNVNVINTCNSLKKNTLPTLDKIINEKTDVKENKNFEISNTYRKKRNTENNPALINYRKYSKDNKDQSLVLELHKYFFQEGESDNIDTLIKYNLNKIKINDSKDKENEKDKNENFDYYTIKQQVIIIMDKFANSFDKGDKAQLISAIKDLNEFSEKYRFDYVSQLTSDWLNQIKDKKYDNCELKYIGYYNQIRDIIEVMLKEVKKKEDLILLSQEKKNKENKKETNDKNSNKNIKENKSEDSNNNIQKMNSINKEDLLNTKEIVPIKIDIEVQNSLNINEVEEILRNLDEGDLGNLGSKVSTTNVKKVLNKNVNNRNDNELEAFCYPFKEDRICYIF